MYCVCTLTMITWWLLTTLTLSLVDPGMIGSQILHSSEKKLGAFNNTSLRRSHSFVNNHSVHFWQLTKVLCLCCTKQLDRYRYDWDCLKVCRDNCYCLVVTHIASLLVAWSDNICPPLSMPSESAIPSSTSIGFDVMALKDCSADILHTRKLSDLTGHLQSSCIRGFMWNRKCSLVCSLNQYTGLIASWDVPFRTTRGCWRVSAIEIVNHHAILWWILSKLCPNHELSFVVPKLHHHCSEVGLISQPTSWMCFMSDIGCLQDFSKWNWWRCLSSIISCPSTLWLWARLVACVCVSFDSAGPCFADGVTYSVALWTFVAA